ncbi:leucine-rich repeat receptor protein kinase HPCA1-like [Impatiens glandulifera]|uniref:leucine-rich repeat receptor protein kinase HPCA1-like n=1 Tax=Impatiens glandulifera TaxID=253017 RepID=UPI001FB159DB|nr:leucine-rich repeat receptor protein kinase HPCA1-like [Impatiens glandulifera]
MILSGNNLTGTLTSDLSALTALQYMDLSNNRGLTGALPSSIGNLNNLTFLILVSCGLSGPIPNSIGSLKQLFYLSLSSNRFSGPIPPSIGSLTNLVWLDLTDNQLNGDIPISVGDVSGLDKLVIAKHFHLGMNQLTGNISSKLFSPNMKLIHVILNQNNLSGSIPTTLGYVQTLEVVRLDGNSLIGSVPDNLNNLTSVSELFLSNNNLTGPIPNLQSMNVLQLVDMSNNSFTATDFRTWFATVQTTTLTSLYMENTSLQGQVPSNLFSLPQLQSVVLSNNKLNGTLNIGSTFSSQLTLIDLQNNSITNVSGNAGSNSQVELILMNNPVCVGSGASASYCRIQRINSTFSPSSNCTRSACSSEEIMSPTCKCAMPYSGSLNFMAFPFSNLNDASIYSSLEGTLMSVFTSSGLPVDSVTVFNPTSDENSYIRFETQIFPSGQVSFNRTGISSIGTLLNRQPPLLMNTFGPFYFIDSSYCCFEDMFARVKRSSNTGIIVGTAVAGSFLLVLLMAAAVYAVYQRRKAKKATTEQNPFASWTPEKGWGGIPQLRGARLFSFQEVKKCTDNFSEANCIGSGGYGKVYRGILSSGESVAIKRAQMGSMQGSLEFKTEIELLSRIHHKNVVALVGFCYDQSEQMLVYEYVPNGTLRDSLSGKSGVSMDWMRRLRIGLDSARGLAYLHELADPPIIHRDVKSNNILLDDHWNAKVADFGLSKLISDSLKGHVTTQVKGTLGYMDPEYYMTQQLTDKSDVYSFGVVMLELVTARAPIAQGKHIVKEVRMAMDTPNELQLILDPTLDTSLGGLEKFLDLAMSCVRDSSDDRPTMSEVVRGIEGVMQLAGINFDSRTVNNSATSGVTPIGGGLPPVYAR